MAKIELTTAEQETLNGIATTLAPPVLTEYPETDASKAGQRFIYKGNEWHYMTQAEIDFTGWNGLVEVGFPAPVSKVFNPELLFGGREDYIFQPNSLSASTLLPEFAPATGLDLVIDMLGLGNPSKIRSFFLPANGFSSMGSFTFKNVNLLTNLEGLTATTDAVRLSSLGLSAIVIDDFFTQLPATEKSATINVANNPGSATCDPTIATNKGYTVNT